MTNHASFSTSGFFDREMAEAYDRRNSGLQPIADSLHFPMGLVLDRLPEQARILRVGVGTGADILALANDRPRMDIHRRRPFGRDARGWPQKAEGCGRS